MKDVTLGGPGEAAMPSFMGGYLEQGIISFKIPEFKKSPTESVLDRLKWYGNEVNILVQDERAYTLLVLENRRLDAAVTSEFKQQMQAIIDKGHHRVVLDIGKLDFMDSSGLGALVSVMKTLSERGEVIIAGASGVVFDLFKVTRMDHVFTLCDSLDEAGKQFLKAA